jgi:nitrite reductase/ring-hydroxylating ferredoxin subunit
MEAEPGARDWQPVPGPLPAAGATRAFEAGGLSLLLCNAGGAWYAIENRCPHAAARLDDGPLRGSVLECAVHGGRLDVCDGRPLRAPIRRRVATYPVRQTPRGLEVALPGEPFGGSA